MRTTRTHYEVLGLRRGAALVQIRRAYKKLVRKYHPDVAKDKATAHRLFLQIKDAYEVLSDPVRRRAYDETLELREQRRSRTTASAARKTPPRRARTQTPTTQSQHIKNAQYAFIQRRFHEATNHCKQALRLDPANARAHAVLGDIYRAQGKVNAAMKAYSFALQFNPADRETEKKLTNLVGKRIADTRTRVRSVPSQSRLVVVNAIGWALAFFLIMLIGARESEPIPWLAFYIPPISMWSWSLVILMAASSMVVGVLLSINGLVEHPDEELVFESTGSKLAIIPTGPILLIGSGFFFLAAAALYIALGLIQGSLSRSVLTVFGCVMGVVLLSAFMYNPQAWSQVLLFGGNIAFLSSLFGWYIGATLRPLSAY